MTNRTPLQAARDLRRAYPTMTAMRAMQVAREALAADHATVGKRKEYRIAAYGYTPPGAPFGNAAFKAGSTDCRWIEKPDAHGMRDCGDAHEIVRSLARGWYVDNDDNEIAVACVYRWGRYYVPAVRDPHGNDAVVIAWGDRVACADTTDEDADNSALRDAAHAADHIAELYADSERRYDAASSAGQRWRDLGDEANALRASVRQLLRDLRGLVGMPASVCAALRGSVAARLSELQELREQRATLAAGDYVAEWMPGFDARDASLIDAFCDGAGIGRDQFARLP